MSEHEDSSFAMSGLGITFGPDSLSHKPSTIHKLPVLPELSSPEDSEGTSSFSPDTDSAPSTGHIEETETFPRSKSMCELVELKGPYGRFEEDSDDEADAKPMLAGLGSPRPHVAPQRAISTALSNQRRSTAFLEPGEAMPPVPAAAQSPSSMESGYDLLYSGGERARHSMERSEVSSLERASACGVSETAVAQRVEQNPAQNPGPNPPRTPSGPPRTSRASPSPTPTHLLRNSTLLTPGAHTNRHNAELNRVLNPADKSAQRRFSIIENTQQQLPVILEQSKAKTRVELDLILDTATVVEGGALTGKIQAKIRKAKLAENDVWLACPKVRIVGYEELSAPEVRHTFYHHTATVSVIQPYSAFESASSAAEMLLPIHASLPNEEGFCKGVPGQHSIPFRIALPLAKGAKGSWKGKQGLVRYVVIASLKLRSASGNDKSIAHFYRHVDVFPFFNPAQILSPAPKPIISSASKPMFMGGQGKVTLTAKMHRSNWVAGQRCYIDVKVDNESTKKIKTLSFALMRAVTLVKSEGNVQTTRKKLSETTLDMGKKAKGVTAKGSWLGAEPNEVVEYSHFLTIPSDSLSIAKSKHIEVSYYVKVSAGAALSTDVSTELPVRVVSFASIDPPPGHSSLTDRALMPPPAMAPVRAQPPVTPMHRRAPSQLSLMSPHLAHLQSPVFGSPGRVCAPASPKEASRILEATETLADRDLHHQISLDCLSTVIASATARNTGMTPLHTPRTPSRLRAEQDVFGSSPIASAEKHDNGYSDMAGLGVGGGATLSMAALGGLGYVGAHSHTQLDDLDDIPDDNELSFVTERGASDNEDADAAVADPYALDSDAELDVLLEQTRFGPGDEDESDTEARPRRVLTNQRSVSSLKGPRMPSLGQRTSVPSLKSATSLSYLNDSEESEVGVTDTHRAAVEASAGSAGSAASISPASAPQHPASPVKGAKSRVFGFATEASPIKMGNPAAERGESDASVNAHVNIQSSPIKARTSPADETTKTLRTRKSTSMIRPPSGLTTTKPAAAEPTLKARASLTDLTHSKSVKSTKSLSNLKSSARVSTVLSNIELSPLIERGTMGPRASIVGTPTLVVGTPTTAQRGTVVPSVKSKIEALESRQKALSNATLSRADSVNSVAYSEYGTLNRSRITPEVYALNRSDTMHSFKAPLFKSRN